MSCNFTSVIFTSSIFSAPVQSLSSVMYCDATTTAEYTIVFHLDLFSFCTAVKICLFVCIGSICLSSRTLTVFVSLNEVDNLWINASSVGREIAKKYAWIRPTEKSRLGVGLFLAAPCMSPVRNARTNAAAKLSVVISSWRLSFVLLRWLCRASVRSLRALGTRRRRSSGSNSCSDAGQGLLVVALVVSNLLWSSPSAGWSAKRR